MNKTKSTRTSEEKVHQFFLHKTYNIILRANDNDESMYQNCKQDYSFKILYF